MTNQQDDDSEESQESGRPNKTALKKEMHAIQDLALSIVNLSTSDFESIQLSPDIRDEVLNVRKIKSHIARRRQLRYLVSYIADSDVEAVRKAVNELQAGKRVDTVKFKEIETLRDRVVNNDPQVLTEIMQRFPEVDLQQLRQLQRNAAKELKAGNQTKSQRLIFRFIRELFDALE